MSRDEGFAIADISTSKFDDAKVKKLWRALAPDEAAMAVAVSLYEATQLASWRHGERVTAEDAAPLWISDVATPTHALVEAGLLDSGHRIPRRPWTVWFGTAQKRREETRERWRRSKRKPPEEGDPSTNVSEASTQTPRGSRADSSVPSVRPSVRNESLTESGQQQPRATRRATGLSTSRNGKPKRVGDVMDDLMTPELRAAMAFAERAKR